MNHKIKTRGIPSIQNSGSALYVIKRTTQGKSKRKINRCLKRYIVHEIYRELCVPKDAKATP